MGSSVRRYVVLLAALSTIFVGVLVSGATAATTSKPYSADITPACVKPSTSTQFTVTLRNTTKTQMLGSANITAPPGFLITSATPDGTTVELRDLNLAPGGTTTRPFTATTSGTTGTADWSIIAKQSNDYNGSPGNNLSLNTANSHLSSYVGTCVLSFLTQPKDAKVGANITSVVADPAGPPVRVEVLNGPGGQRVTTSNDVVSLAITAGTGTGPLSPATPTATAVNGVASFDATASTGFSIGSFGLAYQVTASNPAMTSADSAAFGIADDVVLCSGHGCNANVSKNDVLVNVTAPLADANDIILVALDAQELSCAGYTPLAGTPVVTFVLVSNSYRVVTIRIPASLATRPAAQDLVCYSSALSFVDRAGTTVPSEGSGLLPDCKSKTPLSAPCQFPTAVDKTTGDHIVSFRAPAGATRGRT
jgi:hypothetical protein